MEELLELMERAQRGEEAPLAGAAAGVACPSPNEEDDDDTALELEECDESRIWRPDVKPPKGVPFTSTAERLGPVRVDLDLEIQRQKAVSTLTCLFLNTVKGLGLDVRVPPFERWLLSQRHDAGDPILPDARATATADGRAGRALLYREIKEAGASKKDANKLCDHLSKSAIKVLRKLQRDFPSGAVARDPSDQGRRVSLQEGDKGYTLKYKSHTQFINKCHYHKLEELFARHAVVIAGTSERTRRFHLHLMAVLIRYGALAGGTNRGGGFQGALNERCFDVLLRRFNCRMECFASPLNCRYGRYCSAFQELDGCFGSLGSFFEFHPREGCFEANPPFVPFMMNKMAAHMSALLEASTRPLCFIIVIPACHSADRRAIQRASMHCWQLLVESPFHVHTLILKAQEHGYVEGGQQLRPTRYKTSVFDTGVIFLQNEQAKNEWPVTEEACQELRKAFQSQHVEELEARRTGTDTKRSAEDAWEPQTVVDTKVKKRKRSEG